MTGSTRGVGDRVTATPPQALGTGAPGAGSHDAFHTHVVGEIDVLYRVAVTLTRHPTDAEDLVQDTLLRAYRAIDRFDGRHPRAWLLTILRHTHYNRIRKQQPLLLADGESAERVLEQAATAAPSSEEVALAEQFEPVVARALAELPAEFRVAIDLVDLQGLSYAQAAARLGIPQGTVMSRLHRGRRRIRATLDEAGLVPHPRRTS
jgi:RNA polymerase sigma-70 factor (ECF subfamily)